MRRGRKLQQVVGDLIDVRWVHWLKVAAGMPAQLGLTLGKVALVVLVVPTWLCLADVAERAAARVVRACLSKHRRARVPVAVW